MTQLSHTMRHILSEDGHPRPSRGTDTPRRILSREMACDIVAWLEVSAIVGAAYFSKVLYLDAILQSGQSSMPFIEIGILGALLTHLHFRYNKLYDTSDMYDFPARWSKLFIGLGLAFLFILATGVALKMSHHYSRVWFALWFITSLLLIITIREISSLTFRSWTRQRLFDQNVAVFGAGRVGRKLFEHFRTQNLGVRFVGIFDDRGDRRVDPKGMRIVGDLDDLIAKGRRGEIDSIVIALPQNAERRISRVAMKLEQLPVDIHICTHIASDLIRPGPRPLVVSHLGPIGLLNIKRKPVAEWGSLLKAIEDYAIGGMMLVAFAPLMAIVALAIRLDSPGPVLFRQKRHGCNRRVIEVLKFRTMTVMEDGGAVRQATREDRRITRVGRFLRRTSLDELPQIINVLKGEMSLVGPRPHALAHDEYFGELLETYANRHQVKPGITGWAQVNGFRGETPRNELMRKRVEYDLSYIDNWSLTLDLRILLMTLITGFINKNAY